VLITLVRRGVRVMATITTSTLTTVCYCVCLDWGRAEDADVHTVDMILPVHTTEEYSSSSESVLSHPLSHVVPAVVVRTTISEESSPSKRAPPACSPCSPTRSATTDDIDDDNKLKLIMFSGSLWRYIDTLL
jgi:hypothetical protein